MKYFAALMLTTSSVGVLASPKQLVCENNGHIDSWAAKYPKFYEKQCDKWGDKRGDCKRLELARQEIKSCYEQGIDWSHRALIILDTDELSKGTGEMSSKPCWSHQTPSKKIEIDSTPATISISLSNGETWNIDRKTLKAGNGTSRDFQCRIQDIDTSANKL